LNTKTTKHGSLIGESSGASRYATIRISFVRVTLFAPKKFFECCNPLSRFDVPPIRVSFVQPTDESIASGA
jgi:hypothetical protein